MFEDHKLYPNVTYHCNTCCDMIPFLSHYSITASSLNNFSGNSTANRRLRLTTLISYLIAPADKSLPLAAIHYHNATRKGCANRHNPSLSYAQQPLFMRVTISIGYVRQPRRSSSCPWSILSFCHNRGPLLNLPPPKTTIHAESSLRHHFSRVLKKALPIGL